MGSRPCLLFHLLLLEAVVCWQSQQAGTHVLPFPCGCPGHGVLRAPGTSWRQCLPSAVMHLYFVLDILQLLPLVCLCLFLFTQPMCFWDCSFPGSVEAIVCSFSWCSYISTETLNFLLCNLPDFYRIFYFSVVVCLFLCPAEVV